MFAHNTVHYRQHFFLETQHLTAYTSVALSVVPHAFQYIDMFITPNTFPLDVEPAE